MAKVKKSELQKKTARNGKNVSGVKTSGAKPRCKGHAEVDAALTIDRRVANDRRKADDRRAGHAPVAAEHRKLERRQKVNRRRQIDPTTCERSYSPEELEFMTALDDYKRTSGRMFPTCSEVLEVLRGLGYEKPAKVPATPQPEPAVEAPVAYETAAVPYEVPAL
jgi:hypothetical protein